MHFHVYMRHPHYIYLYICTFQIQHMARRFILFWHARAGKFYVVRLPRAARGRSRVARGVRQRTLSTWRARRPDIKFWVVVRMVRCPLGAELYISTPAPVAGSICMCTPAPRSFTCTRRIYVCLCVLASIWAIFLCIPAPREVRPRFPWRVLKLLLQSG